MTSSKRILCAALAAALLLPALAAPAAEAGIGGGIGITFPTSHSSGKEGRTATYAGVRVGDLSQELTLREKDGQLQLKLRVRNEGDALYMVEHPTGQNCDFALLDAKGNELWRWSDGMAFTQAFQTYALEPGTAEELTAEIDRKTYQKIKDKAYGNLCLRRGSRCRARQTLSRIHPRRYYLRQRRLDALVILRYNGSESFFREKAAF